MIDAQSEDFGRIAGLYAVAFALAGVTSNDGEVRTSDGEDGTAIVGVGVELALLGVGEGAVGHGGRGCAGWMEVDVGRDGSDDEQRGRREMGRDGGRVYR